jgi:hypothetical protein
MPLKGTCGAQVNAIQKTSKNYLSFVAHENALLQGSFIVGKNSSAGSSWQAMPSMETGHAGRMLGSIDNKKGEELWHESTTFRAISQPPFASRIGRETRRT